MLVIKLCCSESWRSFDEHRNCMFGTFLTRQIKLYETFNDEKRLSDRTKPLVSFL